MAQNIISSSELKSLRNELRNKRIALATGCFDVLHVGHIYYLQTASKQGDILVVGINSDRSVKILKGEHRPIISENDRTELISSIRYVDFVFVFDDIVVDKYIIALKPDVFVIGEESVTLFPSEVKAAQSIGSKVHVIQRLSSYSTTSIVSRLLKSEEK